MRKPDLSAVLSGLKDFQRSTVDYVFKRLYEDDDSVRRFLLADEVGLGKTLVTRGVIARAIDRLWESTSASTSSTSAPTAISRGKMLSACA